MLFSNIILLASKTLFHAVALPPPGQRIYVDYPDPQKGILLFAEQIDEKNIKIEDIIGTGD